MPYRVADAALEEEVSPQVRDVSGSKSREWVRPITRRVLWLVVFAATLALGAYQFASTGSAH